jgi:hypothetical protein
MYQRVNPAEALGARELRRLVFPWRVSPTLDFAHDPMKINLMLEQIGGQENQATNLFSDAAQQADVQLSVDPPDCRGYG